MVNWGLNDNHPHYSSGGRMDGSQIQGRHQDEEDDDDEDEEERGRVRASERRGRERVRERERERGGDGGRWRVCAHAGGDVGVPRQLRQRRQEHGHARGHGGGSLAAGRPGRLLQAAHPVEQVPRRLLLLAMEVRGREARIRKVRVRDLPATHAQDAGGPSVAAAAAAPAPACYAVVAAAALVG